MLQRSPHLSLVTDEPTEGASGFSAGGDSMTGMLDEMTKRRNVKALERAIKDNHGVLVGWLTKKLGSAADAADVAQDVYVRVYKFAAVECIDNPQALLFKTAANQIGRAHV